MTRGRVAAAVRACGFAPRPTIAAVQPALLMSCISLAGGSLSCARARHAEAARSGMRSGRHVSSMVGYRAGRRELVSDV